MAALPDVVKQMAENIKWTTDLGNAFLAQQSDVMDAAQRMRKKAKDAGNLKSSEQQKVETQVVESKQVIVIQQASPEVVYVPSYNPTVVYGRAGLSVPAYCLSATRVLRRWYGDLVRRSESRWERPGAAVGAITAGGAATTTSPSIETTPS